MTRALVVDDSQFMRTVVGNELRGEGYDVVEASNGKRALEAVEEHEPDVITMDVEMPEMDGIEATERIMEWRPTPVLMVSAYTAEGAEATLDALENGAVDFIQKPDGEVSLETEPLEAELARKVEAALKADLDVLAPVETPAADADVAGAGDGETMTASAATPEPEVEDRPAPTTSEDISSIIEGQLADEYVDAPTIVLGASTGGPKIVNRMLRALPRTLDARVIVVQHMPASFTGRFAARLDALSAYDVAEVEDGERIGGGDVRVARGGTHLEVASYSSGRVRLKVTDSDPVHGVRPSIDVTMESAAETVAGPLVGVVLTGMGKDGAEGIRAVKEAGGITFAQDEASSPVFGIPEQAIATGCVDHVLSADELVEGILDALSKEGD
jgi:two-component system chemotaxis response regulator CheB